MQGFNMGRYVPPDLEGTTTGNKLHNKKPPGRHGNTQTVRFEMPYPIWCSSCPKPTIIGQGVRFNAEKRRVGAYYSTAIWSFRFRHLACGGAIEMRTDPKNTAYVVVEGAKKRDLGEEERVIQTKDERDTARQGAFANLEKTIEDREQYRRASDRIEELAEVTTRQWDDPYAQNQKLRRTFREGRKRREAQADRDENLRGRLGVGVDLLPETEEDALGAKLVEFAELDEATGRGEAMRKPMFTKPARELPPIRGLLKTEAAAERRRSDLVTEVMGNTRAVKDPFLQEAAKGGRPPARLPGVKRKRPGAAVENAGQVKSAASGGALVSYDSDSA